MANAGCSLASFLQCADDAGCDLKITEEWEGGK